MNLVPRKAEQGIQHSTQRIKACTPFLPCFASFLLLGKQLHFGTTTATCRCLVWDSRSQLCGWIQRSDRPKRCRSEYSDVASRISQVDRRVNPALVATDHDQLIIAFREFGPISDARIVHTMLGRAWKRIHTWVLEFTCCPDHVPGTNLRWYDGLPQTSGSRSRQNHHRLDETQVSQQ